MCLWCRERDLNPRPSDDSGISKGAYGVNVPFGCPMSPTRYQLRHPGDASGTSTVHLSVSVIDKGSSHPQG